MFNLIPAPVRRAALALALAATSGLAAAGTIHVDLDTSSFGGGNGYLDMQLGMSAGPVVTARVSSLSGFDTSSLADGWGYTLDNGAYTLRSDVLNDLFHAVHFGGMLGFDLTLSSDADVDGHVTNFLVSAFDGSGVNPVGVFDPFNLSLANIAWTPAAAQGGEGSIAVTATDPGVAAVPEPGVWLLMAAGALGMAFTRRRRVH
jgi:hypothetical protein